MSLIEDMFQYYKTGNIDLLIKSELIISERDLNVIVIDIFSWLKLEYKRMIWRSEGKKVVLKPLILHTQYAWCKNLMLLVENEEEFKKYFSIKDNNLDFNESICKEEREMMRKMAFDRYNPPKMT